MLPYIVQQGKTEQFFSDYSLAIRHAWWLVTTHPKESVTLRDLPRGAMERLYTDHVHRRVTWRWAEEGKGDLIPATGPRI